MKIVDMSFHLFLIQMNILPYLSGFFNLVSDLYILIIPLPFIWDLKLTVSRRLRLMAVFSTGVL